MKENSQKKMDFSRISVKYLLEKVYESTVWES